MGLNYFQFASEYGGFESGFWESQGLALKKGHLPFWNDYRRNSQIRWDFG